MKFFISILFLLIASSLPASTANVSSIEQSPENKKISISGKCFGDKVIIQLFRNSDSIDYSGERPCADGTYELTDDLNYWKLPTGNYNVSVRDDETLFTTSTTNKQIIISEPEIQPIETVEVVATTEEQATTDNTTAPTTDMDGGFFQKIIEWLVEWFKTTIVQINELIAHKTTTDQLCLGATCIEEQELQNLLQNTPPQKLEITPTEPVTEKLPDETPIETLEIKIEPPPEAIQ